MAVIPIFAGSPGPPFSESGTLEYVEKLKEAKDEVMPGDKIPRRLRLVGALYSLANFYNSNKSYEKADQYYGETFAILVEDKSVSGLSSYRYYAESTARDYMERGDLVKAKSYIDIALKICREDSKQKEVLPSVLTTLARCQKKMKLMKEAESTLLEAIGILGDYGSEQRKDLARIYLETNQHEKADQIIAALEKSTTMSYNASSVMFLRVQWLRSAGKIKEAEELEKKAKAKEAKEHEDLKNSQ
jgi:tetratricopeptide (TPR) repeat protein